ncbi:hypothetical protein P9112_008858 [Eukaryota sp. TZLM1-RC]
MSNYLNEFSIRVGLSRGYESDEESLPSPRSRPRSSSLPEPKSVTKRFSRRASLQLERFYTKNSVIPVDENQFNEFKAVQISKSLTTVIPRLALDYVNAFLNSGSAGTIYFGIEDDGTILGVILPRSLRDEIRLKIDGGLNYFKPQVDPKLLTIEFVPVVSDSGFFIEDLFVLEVSVAIGTHPVYFTSRYSAFIRTSAGITKMSQSLIDERLGFAKRRNSISSQVFTNSTFNAPSDLLGRDNELSLLTDFFTSNTAQHKIALIYGFPLSGKSALARVLMQKLLDHHGQDTVGNEYFDESPLVKEEDEVPIRHLTLDMSGICNRHLASKDAMRLALKSQAFKFDEHNLKGVDLKAKYQSLFAGRRCFLLLESAGNLNNVLDLLPSSDYCFSSCVVITSRKNLSIDSLIDGNQYLTLSMKLNPLSSFNGALLLKSLCPQLKHVEAEKISQAVGNLPHAIMMSAAILNRRQVLSADSFCSKLSDGHFDDSWNGSEPLSTLYNLIKPTLEHIPPESRHLAEVCSVFPRSFTYESLIGVVGCASRLAVVEDGLFSNLPDIFANFKESLIMDSLSLLIEDSLISFDSTSQRYCLLDAIRNCLWHSLSDSFRKLFKRAFSDYFVGIISKKLNRNTALQSDSKHNSALQSLLYSESSNFEALVKILDDDHSIQGRGVLKTVSSLLSKVFTENVWSIVDCFDSTASDTVIESFSDS